MSSSHDKIFIHQLQAQCILGVTEEERKNPQTIFLDLKIKTNFSKPAQTDRIEDAVDYDQICKVVTRFIENSSFHLLEALVESIANLIFTQFAVDELKLKIFKPKIISNVERVGVEIYRVRRFPSP